MDPHFIELPRVVLIGNNVISRIPEICHEIGHNGKILVLADKTTKDIVGSQIKDMLDAEIDIVEDSCQIEVDRIIARNMPDQVIAAGGGKVIDVAKMVSFNKDVPFISVPTAPSHDGIASERASIKANGEKKSLRAKPPAAIVADIGILKSAPYRLIASGAADVISNYTAVNDWKIASHSKGVYYSDYAGSLSLLSSEIVIGSANDIRAQNERGIRNLVEALVSSGIAMSLVGSSRPASGAEHAFSHALDTLGTDALHGEQCGIGSIIMAAHQEKKWERIKLALDSLMAPITANKIGIEKNKIIDALILAKSIRERYTILDEKPIDREEAIKLCERTGIF